MVNNSRKYEELKSALSDTNPSHRISPSDLLGVNKNYIDISAVSHDNDAINKDMYDTDKAIEIYRNFLDWLFGTFKTDETEFRHSCLKEMKAQKGDRVLITSCGLGEDVVVAAQYVGSDGFVHAQDLSRFFVQETASKFDQDNVVLTISNALSLPYKDNYFDAVYHFGGINLFGDLQKAISEMDRVCKTGGKVVFGDESVAPHLRETDYGKMFMENNSLWEAPLPLEKLPPYAHDISVKYVLGNCFYLLSYTKGNDYPETNIDIEHKGLRGGSVRTRYFGKIEGIAPKTKKNLYEMAQEKGVSVSRLLEELISNAKK